MYLISLSFVLLILTNREIFGSALFLMLFTAVYNPVLKATFKMPLPPSCGIDDYGLPSGHIHMLCVFMGVLFFYSKKLWQKISIVIFIILASIASVYFGKHYIIDIVPCPLLVAISIFVYKKMLNLFKNNYVKVFLVTISATLACAIILYLFDKDNITSNTFMYIFLLLGLGVSWNLYPKITLTLWQKNFSLIFVCCIYFLLEYTYSFIDSLIFINATKWFLVSLSIFPIMKLSTILIKNKTVCIKCSKNKLVTILVVVCSMSSSYANSCKYKKIEVVKSIDNVKPFSEKNNVLVVFCSDNNYALYLGVSVHSLIVNSNENINYDIWVLDGGICETDRKLLLNLKNGNSNISIRFFDINPYIIKNKEIFYIIEGMHFNMAMYYRLFIPNIFYRYKKAIYLDCDLVINTDISKLYDIDLNGKSIGAIKEPGDPAWIKYRRKIKKKKWKDYFNSGVLVLDVSKLIKSNFLKKCLLYLSLNKDLKYPDQDALNAICDVKLIDKSWNCFPKKWQRCMIDEMNIVHYVGRKKPWHKHNLDFDEAWWGYAKETQLYDKIIKNNNEE